jgi:hypothetical protein
MLRHFLTRGDAEMMFYKVSAYLGPVLIKTREVKGIDNVIALEALWEKQGYETDAVMSCLKYIAVQKLLTDLQKPSDITSEFPN